MCALLPCSLIRLNGHSQLLQPHTPPSFGCHSRELCILRWVNQWTPQPRLNSGSSGEGIRLTLTKQTGPVSSSSKCALPVVLHSWVFTAEDESPFMLWYKGSFSPPPTEPEMTCRRAAGKRINQGEYLKPPSPINTVQRSGGVSDNAAYRPTMTNYTCEFMKSEPQVIKHRGSSGSYSLLQVTLPNPDSSQKIFTKSWVSENTTYFVS